MVKAMAWEGGRREEMVVTVTCSCRLSTDANSCDKLGTASTSIVLETSMLALSAGAFIYDATVDCDIYDHQTSLQGTQFCLRVFDVTVIRLWEQQYIRIIRFRSVQLDVNHPLRMYSTYVGLGCAA